MKKLKPLLSIALFTLCSLSHGTVWRVNNASGIDADFKDLQAAIDDAAVQPFDTLYVEGSLSIYGENITVEKPIIIIGPGYFLNENDSTQAIKKIAEINSITFNLASEGSKMMGMYITGDGRYGINIYASDITIERNRIYMDHLNSNYKIQAILIGSGSLTGIVFSKNYMQVRNRSSQGAYAIYSGNNGLQLNIMNNYIEDFTSHTTPHAMYIAGTTSHTHIINNNVIKGNINTTYSSFSNNILVSGAVVTATNVYYNNICNETQFENTDGNQQNVDMTTVFVDHTSGIDNGLLLLDGSPATGAGLNGEDCGIFGGPGPYVLSGLPPIPSIFEIIHSGAGADNSSIPVKLKARSNR